MFAAWHNNWGNGQTLFVWKGAAIQCFTMETKRESNFYPFSNITRPVFLKSSVF